MNETDTTTPVPEKQLNTRIDGNLFKEFKKITVGEGLEMKDVLQDLMKDYVKKHGDGNPGFTLDHWQQPDFTATPALFRPSEAWQKYYDSLNLKDYRELDREINKLLRIHNANLDKVSKRK